MTTTAEDVVRAAYDAAEGDVLDVQGFIDLFAEDGVFNNIVAGESYRGEHLGDLVVFMGQLAPDVHRELHRFHVTGDLAAVELSIQGTVSGPFPTPAGVIQTAGASLTSRPPTSGTSKTARSRSSTATSGSASCSPSSGCNLTLPPPSRRRRRRPCSSDPSQDASGRLWTERASRGGSDDAPSVGTPLRHAAAGVA